MTCVHVVGLIDAGPFAGYPPEHVAAALEHAHACPSCGSALAASQALGADLAALPRVDAPPDLQKAVMARIARLEEVPTTPAIRHAWTSWATIGGGISAASAFVIELAAAWHVLTADARAVLVLLSVSLVLYSAGLFAPLAARRQGLRGD